MAALHIMCRAQQAVAAGCEARGSSIWARVTEPTLQLLLSRSCCRRAATQRATVRAGQGAAAAAVCAATSTCFQSSVGCIGCCGGSVQSLHESTQVQQAQQQHKQARLAKLRLAAGQLLAHLSSATGCTGVVVVVCEATGHCSNTAYASSLHLQPAKASSVSRQACGKIVAMGQGQQATWHLHTFPASTKP